jgi:hypothetical protein
MSDTADEINELIETSRKLLDHAKQLAERQEQLTRDLQRNLAALKQTRSKKNGDG